MLLLMVFGMDVLSFVVCGVVVLVVEGLYVWCGINV